MMWSWDHCRYGTDGKQKLDELTLDHLIVEQRCENGGRIDLTYVAEGSVSYEDTNGAMGLLRTGLEWMRASGRVWHGGGSGEPGRTRGLQCHMSWLGQD